LVVQVAVCCDEGLICIDELAWYLATCSLVENQLSISECSGCIECITCAEVVLKSC